MMFVLWLWFFGVMFSALVYMDPGMSQVYRISRAQAEVIFVLSFVTGPIVGMLWVAYAIYMMYRMLQGDK